MPKLFESRNIDYLLIKVVIHSCRECVVAFDSETKSLLACDETAG